MSSVRHQMVEPWGAFSKKHEHPTWDDFIERWGSEKTLLREYALSHTHVPDISRMSTEERNYLDWEYPVKLTMSWEIRHRLKLLNAKVDVLIRRT